MSVRRDHQRARARRQCGRRRGQHEPRWLHQPALRWRATKRGAQPGFLFGATPLPSNILFITYGLMRVKNIGIYVGFWFGRTISYIIMIYFGNAVLRPFFEIFEDRLVGILLIDGVGIGMIFLFASINWTVLITERKIKFVKPKIWRF